MSNKSIFSVVTSIVKFHHDFHGSVTENKLTVPSPDICLKRSVDVRVHFSLGAAKFQ